MDSASAMTMLVRILRPIYFLPLGAALRIARRLLPGVNGSISPKGW
jgi:hypothetical protein